MKPKREIPPEWKALMDRRGIPSIRQLGFRAGLSQPAVNSLVMGDGQSPSEDTLARVAGALGVPLAYVYELAGRPAPHAEFWVPPAEANRLTPIQRQAVEALIRSMVDPS